MKKISFIYKAISAVIIVGVIATAAIVIAEYDVLNPNNRFHGRWKIMSVDGNTTPTYYYIFGSDGETFEWEFPGGGSFIGTYEVNDETLVTIIVMTEKEDYYLHYRYVFSNRDLTLTLTNDITKVVYVFNKVE